MSVVEAEPQILCAHAVFCKLFAQIACWLVAFVLDAKSAQKSVQNERQASKKSTPETMLFSTSIVWHIGTYFGGGRDTILEPCWYKLAFHNWLWLMGMPLWLVWKPVDAGSKFRAGFREELGRISGRPGHHFGAMLVQIGVP